MSNPTVVNILSRSSKHNRIADCCRYYFPCRQPSGSPQNEVGFPAIKNAALTDALAWADAGWLTLGGVANAYATLANTYSQLNNSMDAGSLLIALRIKKATPGANSYIIASYNPGSVFGGFVIEVRTDGNIRCYVNSITNATAQVGATGALDGNEHQVLFAFNKSADVYTGSNSNTIFIDGILKGTGSASAINGLSLAGTSDLYLGANVDGTVTPVSIAEFQVYEPAATLSQIPLQNIANRLFRFPDMPLSNEDFML